MYTLCINDIFALQSLLTEDLYLIDEKNDAVQQHISFNYVGENQAHFLILLENKEYLEIAPAILEILLKITSAKGLKLEDLAILNCAHYPDLKFDDLKSFFACTALVLFGIKPLRIGLPELAINKIHIIQHVRVMASYSLEEMEMNQDKKREFWNMMKKL